MKSFTREREQNPAEARMLMGNLVLLASIRVYSVLQYNSGPIMVILDEYFDFLMISVKTPRFNLF